MPNFLVNWTSFWREGNGLNIWDGNRQFRRKAARKDYRTYKVLRRNGQLSEAEQIAERLTPAE